MIYRQKAFQNPWRLPLHDPGKEIAFFASLIATSLPIMDFYIW